MRSEFGAGRFMTLLDMIRSVIASGLAKSGMTLRYDTRQQGARVIIDVRLAGFRKTLIQALAGR
jgi:HSP20 family molecular chaperone IbpA